MLGLDPDPGALWPGGAARGAARSARAGAPQRPFGALPGAARCRRRRRAWRSSRSSPASSCSARRDGRSWKRSWRTRAALGLLVIADGKRGDIDVTARPTRGALIGGADSPFGRARGPGRRPRDRQPADGPATRSSRSSTAARAGGGRRAACWCAPPTRARPTSRIWSWRRSGPVWERIAEIVRRARRRRRRRGGPQRRRRGRRRDRARAPRARPRADAGARRSCCPASGRRAAACEELAAGVRAGPRRRPGVSASRSIADAHARRRRRRRRPRAPSAERLREQAWALSERRLARARAGPLALCRARRGHLLPFRRAGRRVGARMIITVTLNAAIDKSLAVPNFRLGRRHRTVDQRTMAGGKGVNIARTLKALGQPVIATGFAGGATGTHIVEQLTEESILNDFVRIREESRTNTSVLDPTTGEQTEINERGPSVSTREVELFRDKLAVPRAGRRDRGVRRLAAARGRARPLRVADQGPRAPGRDHGRRHRRRAAAPGGARRAGCRLAERARGGGARRPRVRRRGGALAGGGGDRRARARARRS